MEFYSQIEEEKKEQIIEEEEKIELANFWINCSCLYIQYSEKSHTIIK